MFLHIASSIKPSILVSSFSAWSANGFSNIPCVSEKQIAKTLRWMPPKLKQPYLKLRRKNDSNK